MAAQQPGFLEACREGVMAARNAQCADNAGNFSHSAWSSWGRFTVLALNIPHRRVLDPLITPLERKLEEVDLVEAWAWWLCSQVGVNTETAWSYVCVANACHDRAFGVGFAGGMPLTRVRKMLDGYQRNLGLPITRRQRFGVRPRQLRDGIRATLHPARSAADANVAALMETGLVAVARCAELAATRAGMAFDRSRHPSRADVAFSYGADGQLSGCVLHIVNSKARGAKRLEKLPVHLPISGGFLSPGLALWYLMFVADPVPAAVAARTPLFRDPQSNRILQVSFVRTKLRACMTAIGRDGSKYGAHSLRIGGATALAFLQVPGDMIQAAGRWHSGAYMRYLRETRDNAVGTLTRLAGADTDDLEADFVAVDAHDLDEDDEA